jgi:hypothetical protein
MRGTVLAALLVIAACGGSSAPTALSSPSATNSAGVSAPTPDVSAASNARLDTNTAGLIGDLPVRSYAETEPGGGFLHFPSGVFQRDPLANMVEDATTPNLVRTPDKPYLYSHGGLTTVQISYDRTVGRWLPVNRVQVSDDGLRYAYVDYGVGNVGAASSHGIHVVDARSGSDQVVYRDTNPQYNVVGLVQQNIYLTDCVFTHTSANCWGPLRRLDATTGNITKISDRRGTWVISGRIGWVATCWPTQTPPQCPFGSYNEPGPNQLLRIDLVTGNEETWDSGSGIDLVGIDGDGAPLVMTKTAGESVLVRMSAPLKPEHILTVARTESFIGSGVSDPLGTWLLVVDDSVTVFNAAGPDQGIYLYAKAFGMRKVSDFWGMPVGSMR